MKYNMKDNDSACDFGEKNFLEVHTDNVTNTFTMKD